MFDSVQHAPQFPLVLNMSDITLEVANGGVLYKKAVLKNLAIFRGKQLCRSLFLTKAARPATLSKTHSNTGAFLWILLNFQEHLFWKTSANGYFCNSSVSKEKQPIRTISTSECPTKHLENIWKTSV